MQCESMDGDSAGSDQMEQPRIQLPPPSQVLPRAPMQSPSHAPEHQPPMSNGAPFLPDFNLVAEAAKRAQMAVLMRDLDEVALSGS